MTTTPDRDYVLGTHDDEVARLGLQHNVWRPHALAAWQHAGFNVGQTIIDVGCGPGYATLDLAELVGPTGLVHAVDRSRRFLDVLDARRRARGLENVNAVESDLDELSYEEARDRLVEVVRTLEQGGTSLAESLDLWEQGERLAKVCQRALEGARERLDQALGDADEEE